MKKIFLFALAALALSACTDPKADEKAALNDVIKIHDKVMGYDEQLMQNKMKLDTLLQKANDSTKQKITSLRAKLITADSAMENWMQKFDPEQKGKTHDEILKYMSAQKKAVTAIDSLLSVAVKQSKEYLESMKKQ